MRALGSIVAVPWDSPWGSRQFGACARAAGGGACRADEYICSQRSAAKDLIADAAGNHTPLHWATLGSRVSKRRTTNCSGVVSAPKRRASGGGAIAECARHRASPTCTPRIEWPRYHSQEWPATWPSGHSGASLSEHGIRTPVLVLNRACRRRAAPIHTGLVLCCRKRARRLASGAPTNCVAHSFHVGPVLQQQAHDSSIAHRGSVGQSCQTTLRIGVNGRLSRANAAK